MLLDLVSVVTADGVTLHGTLQRPPAQAPRRFGIDCLTFHHGGGGNFYGPNPLAEAITARLLEGGCAVLRVNSRGHDTVSRGPRGFLGFGAEVVDDCRHDFAAWNVFAADAGFRDIALFGHSNGAVKSIYYGANVPDHRVRAIVAISPPRFCYSAYLALEGGERFAADYGTAEQMIADGQGSSFFLASTPIRMLFSARSYVDRHGPAERYDIAKHLPNLPVPTLVTVGDEAALGPSDPYWLDFAEHKGLLSGIAQTRPLVTFEHVAGATHTYDGPAAVQAWSVVSRWLERTLPAV